MQNSRERGKRIVKISGRIACNMRSAASPMLSGSRLQIEAPCNTYLDQLWHKAAWIHARYTLFPWHCFLFQPQGTSVNERIRGLAASTNEAQPGLA